MKKSNKYIIQKTMVFILINLSEKPSPINAERSYIRNTYPQQQFLPNQELFRMKCQLEL